LDRILTSLVRQRILLALQGGEMNVNELVRRVNSTYIHVSRNLTILKAEGLIEDRHLGAVRMISLNRENEKLQAVLKALNLLRNAAVGKTGKSSRILGRRPLPQISAGPTRNTSPSSTSVRGKEAGLVPAHTP